MKSKFFKSISAVILVLVMSFSFASCAPNATPDSTGDLVIEIRNAGYGISFMDDVVAKFKSEYPEVNVYVYDGAGLLNSEVEAKVKLGEKYNATDLFIVEGAQVHSYVASGANMNKNYPIILESLDEVLNSASYGETTLIKDKIKSEFIEYNTFEDGHVYALPWNSGITGLIYRADFFDTLDINVPRTTNELLAVSEELKDNGYTPLVWNKYGYWQNLYTVWWAQYEGLSEFKKFYSPVDENGKYTYEYFAQQGRYEALTVLDGLIKNENGNSLSGSITYTHIEAQNKLMDSDNKVAMAPSGDWMENEMRRTFPKGSVDIRMMRTPIVSSIIDKLTTVNDEVKLLSVIDAVDAGEASVAGVSAEDFERVKEARKLTFVNGFESKTIIPSYSNAKEHAKNFLRILYSDFGQQSFISNADNPMPLNSDVAKKAENVATYTSFQKSVFEISDNLIGISNVYYDDPLFYLGKLKAFNQYGTPEMVIGGIGADYISGLNVYLNEVNWISSRFDTYLTNSGISK